MSTLPDELTSFVASVRRRRVWYDITTAVIAFALAATVVAGVAFALRVPRVIAAGLAAALLLVILTLMKRAPAWRDRALIDLVEADQPACGNLLVTAYELTREPVLAPVKPYIRARVMSDAVRVAQSLDLDTILPRRIIANLTGFAMMAVLVAALAIVFVTTRSLPAAHAGANAADGTAATRADSADAAAKPPPAVEHVAIEVVPPAYAGLPTTTARDPERLDLLAGSRLRLRIEATADDLTLALDGLAAQTIARRDADSRTFTQELTPTQSGVLAISARTRGIEDAAAPAAAHRLIAVTVTPDLPPVVTISVPGHDLMASDPQGRVRIVANATDDYGLRTLTLRYTKVSGSGERFEFKEAELPLTIARGSARSWEGSVERSLRDLNVDVGDTIVYYAAATDNRPGQPRAVSDSFVIEISQTGAAIAGGFAVPKDEDVFAISLNALIQKTEKLHGKRATMPAAEFAQSSSGLAIEQRMVRSEFLFSMGTHGRVEDEEEEAENSNEIQEGRLENRGQSELAQAVDLMTLAERNLTDANTGDALKAQRAALAAVQRAQSRQRYFLRTIPTGSRIDQNRRLTGNLTEAASSQHPGPTTSPDAQAAALRTLLNDCARLSAALDGANAAQTTDFASSIGARMMALDPTSTQLHAAAASLLQVAPLAARGRIEEARGTVRSAAALLVPLAQRAAAASAGSAASAGATPSDAGAAATDPALRGAVVDALRHAGVRSGGAR
jgi:hypothetical protein